MSNEYGTDPDINALADAIEALNQSSTRQMLEANLRYLMDYYIEHPSENLPEHLRMPKQKAREGR